MTIKFCFLDMDGLLVDFIGGACSAHNFDNPYTGTEEVTSDLVELMGLTLKDFHAPMVESFWVNLKPTPDAMDILTVVYSQVSKFNTAIASFPLLEDNMHGGCMSGKTTWLQNNIPFYRNRYIYAPNKYFLAGPDNVLIDDFERNVLEFQKHGGLSFLYPRPWNSRRSESHNALELLSEFLTTCQNKSG